MQFEPMPAAFDAGLLPLRIHSAIAGQFPPTLSAAADCSSPASVIVERVANQVCTIGLILTFFLAPCQEVSMLGTKSICIWLFFACCCALQQLAASISCMKMHLYVCSAEQMANRLQLHIKSCIYRLTANLSVPAATAATGADEEVSCALIEHALCACALCSLHGREALMNRGLASENMKDCQELLHSSISAAISLCVSLVWLLQHEVSSTSVLLRSGCTRMAVPQQPRSLYHLAVDDSPKTV